MKKLDMVYPILTLKRELATLANEENVDNRERLNNQIERAIDILKTPRVDRNATQEELLDILKLSYHEFIHIIEDYKDHTRTRDWSKGALFGIRLGLTAIDYDIDFEEWEEEYRLKKRGGILMDMTNAITKKQKRLIEKYAVKYGKKYLTNYVQEKYPGVAWEDFNKEQAQYLITGRKKHERHIRELEKEIKETENDYKEGNFETRKTKINKFD